MAPDLDRIISYFEPKGNINLLLSKDVYNDELLRDAVYDISVLVMTLTKDIDEDFRTIRVYDRMPTSQESIEDILRKSTRRNSFRFTRLIRKICKLIRSDVNKSAIFGITKNGTLEPDGNFDLYGSRAILNAINIIIGPQFQLPLNQYGACHTKVDVFSENGFIESLPLVYISTFYPHMVANIPREKRTITLDSTPYEISTADILKVILAHELGHVYGVTNKEFEHLREKSRLHNYIGWHCADPDCVMFYEPTDVKIEILKSRIYFEQLLDKTKKIIIKEKLGKSDDDKLPYCSDCTKILRSKRVSGNN